MHLLSRCLKASLADGTWWKPGTAFRVKADTRFAFELNVDDRDSEEVARKVIMALHGDAANGTLPSKWGRYQLQP